MYPASWRANDNWVARSGKKLSSEYTYSLPSPEHTMSAEPRKLLEEGWSRIRGSRFGLDDGSRSFAIMRTAKIKTLGNMGASLQHTFRERETPNADVERLKDNTILLGGNTSKEVLAGWKDRAPEKIRSNAVHGLEYFVGGSPGKLQAMNREEQDAYFKDALDWIKDRHGAENVLSAVIHRDETTPHMTVMTIPLDDRDKLNARSFVGNKKALSDLQTDFADKVGEPHGLKRGIKHSRARHERVQRVYGHMNDNRAVELPERVRGGLLSGKKESDEEWRTRATKVATEALRGAELRMEKDLRDAGARMQAAATMVENLRVLAENYKAQLDEAEGKLERLTAGLELSGMGKDANKALEAYGKWEEQVEAGDLRVLKEAAGSRVHIERIADICDRVFPEPDRMTEDQARFDRALDTMLDAPEEALKRKDSTRVAIAPRSLPLVEKALARFSVDQISEPFSTSAEQMRFRAEIETSLDKDELIALKQGHEEVLTHILDDPLSEEDQLRLALAYYNTDINDIDGDVRRDVISRLTDIEYDRLKGESHSDTDRGPTH